MQDLVRQRGVEVVRDPELAVEEAQLAAAPLGPDGTELRHRPARLGDDDLLAGLDLLEEAREVRLGFVDVYLFHGTSELD